MHLSHHPTYFVFDNLKDCHYTDTLMALRPEAYLWHELKRDRKADIALFVSMQNQQLRVRTFDTASAEFVTTQNKVFWGSTKKLSAQTVENSTVSPGTIVMSYLNRGEDFLRWLGENAEKNSSLTIALAVSHDAFDALIATGDITSLPQNCFTMIRLPADAAGLEPLLLKDSALLRTYPTLAQCLQTIEEPLMTVLNRQLKDRIISLHHQEEDVRNMLLRHTVCTDGAPDTMDQLRDQAAYLHLCRKYNRLYLLSSAFDDNPCTAPYLSTLSADLETFRKKLRDRTALLRIEYPHGTIEDAMRAKGLISDVSQDHLVYTDPLAINLYALRSQWLADDLPDALCNVDFGQILKLATLWNKPRNALVLEQAAIFCDRARNAMTHRYWDIAFDALYLLSFCADLVCAPASEDENLKKIFSLGLEILNNANSIAVSNKLQSYFTDLPSAASSVPNVAALLTHLHDSFESQESSTLEIDLHMKRLMLRQKISSFYTPDISPEERSNTLNAIQREYDRIHTQANQHRPPLKTTPVPTPAPQPAYTESAAATGEEKPAPEKKRNHREDARFVRDLLYQNALPGGVSKEIYDVDPLDMIEDD